MKRKTHQQTQTSALVWCKFCSQEGYTCPFPDCRQQVPKDRFASSPPWVCESCYLPWKESLQVLLSSGLEITSSRIVYEGPVISVLIRQRLRTREEAVWPERRRLVWCGHEPRSARSPWEWTNPGKGTSPPASGEAALKHLDFRHLTTRTARN